jgi:hypothetical protein
MSVKNPMTTSGIETATFRDKSEWPALFFDCFFSSEHSIRYNLSTKLTRMQVCLKMVETEISFQTIISLDQSTLKTVSILLPKYLELHPRWQFSHYSLRKPQNLTRKIAVYPYSFGSLRPVAALKRLTAIGFRGLLSLVPFFLLHLNMQMCSTKIL